MEAAGARRCERYRHDVAETNHQRAGHRAPAVLEGDDLAAIAEGAEQPFEERAPVDGRPLAVHVFCEDVVEAVESPRTHAHLEAAALSLADGVAGFVAEALPHRLGVAGERELGDHPVVEGLEPGRGRLRAERLDHEEARLPRPGTLDRGGDERVRRCRVVREHRTVRAEQTSGQVAAAGARGEERQRSAYRPGNPVARQQERRLESVGLFRRRLPGAQVVAIRLGMGVDISVPDGFVRFAKLFDDHGSPRLVRGGTAWGAPSLVRRNCAQRLGQDRARPSRCFAQR